MGNNLNSSEQEENYFDLIYKIESFGLIEKTVNDENIINQIIAYDRRGRLLCTLFDKVNIAIYKKQLSPESLTYFRSGKLMDSIINLEETLEKCGSTRTPTEDERGLKIACVSRIEDDETLVVSYTHPKILDALCSDESYKQQDLTNWYNEYGIFTCILSLRVQASIGLALLKTRGNDKLVKSMLENASKELPSYEEKNKVNSMKR